MRLEDGKLYETKRGWRFRVKEDKTDGTFTGTNFDEFWDASGRAFCKVWHDGQYKKPHLVKEVEEKRLISVPSGAEWKARQNQTLCHDHASKKVGRPAKVNGNDVRWVTVEQLKRWRNAMVEGECDYMAAYREILKALEEPADSID